MLIFIFVYALMFHRFIEFEDLKSADEAILHMNGFELAGRPIKGTGWFQIISRSYPCYAVGRAMPGTTAPPPTAMPASILISGVGPVTVSGVPIALPLVNPAVNPNAVAAMLKKPEESLSHEESIYLRDDVSHFSSDIRNI